MIDKALCFLSSTASRHGINFSQNPHVSATINEDYTNWRQIKGIQMEGVKIYKLAPDRILFINNEEGFGHRDELLIGKNLTQMTCP